MTAPRIYLDHAATSPPRPEALAALSEGLALWANPSSPHAAGRAARATLEDARARVAAALDWDGEVLFTSGASEAIERTARHARAGDRYATAVEHDAVLRLVPACVPVQANGLVDLTALDGILSEAERPLLFCQHVNSETGVIQDIAGAAQVVRQHGGLLAVDCAQSGGKLPLPPEADFAIIAGHKLGAPIGIGALLVREAKLLEPSGGQERGYRPGTENLPGALALAAALEAGGEHYLVPAVAAALADFAATVRGAGGVWLADRLAPTLPSIAAVALPGLSGRAQMMRLDMAGIAVSVGSACASGSLKPSHVLEALGLVEEVAGSTIRVSAGWNTTPADITALSAAWEECARSAS